MIARHDEASLVGGEEDGGNESRVLRHGAPRIVEALHGDYLAAIGRAGETRVVVARCANSAVCRLEGLATAICVVEELVTATMLAFLFWE